MKRDIDLIRNLMLRIEDSDGAISFDMNPIEGYSLNEIAFHIELMDSHGLLRGTTVQYGGSGTALNVSVKGLSWNGYDYLDSIRSGKVWYKAKALIQDTVGDTSLSVIKSTCEMVAKALISAKLNM